MAKCSFCREDIPVGKGRMFVKNDGRIFYFCNSKCWKNWKLGREGKNIKWTKAWKEAKTKKK